jgi:hypothetical protein
MYTTQDRLGTLINNASDKPMFQEGLVLRSRLHSSKKRSSESSESAVRTVSPSANGLGYTTNRDIATTHDSHKTLPSAAEAATVSQSIQKIRS